MRKITKLLTGLSVLAVTPVISMVACSPSKGKTNFDVETKKVHQSMADNAVTFKLTCSSKETYELTNVVLTYGEKSSTIGMITLEKECDLRFLLTDTITTEVDAKLSFDYQNKQTKGQIEISDLKIEPTFPQNYKWDYMKGDYSSKITPCDKPEITDNMATEIYFEQLYRDPYTYIDDNFIYQQENLEYDGYTTDKKVMDFEIELYDVDKDSQTVSVYANLNVDAAIFEEGESEPFATIKISGWVKFAELPLAVVWYGSEKGNGDDEFWAIESPVNNSDLPVVDFLEIMKDYSGWGFSADCVQEFDGAKNEIKFNFSDENKPKETSDIVDIADALTLIDGLKSHYLKDVGRGE